MLIGRKRLASAVDGQQICLFHLRVFELIDITERTKCDAVHCHIVVDLLCIIKQNSMICDGICIYYMKHKSVCVSPNEYL